MGKKLDWRPWLRNVITTVISGAAHGLIAGMTTMGVAPDTFNLNQGLNKTLIVAGTCALFSGMISLANLLSNPEKAIPQDIETDTGVHELPKVDGTAAGK